MNTLCRSCAIIKKNAVMFVALLAALITSFIVPPDKEYIEYLPSYSKYEGNYLNYNRLIISFNDDTYTNIEVEYVKE